jgi:hypothetical protein
MTLFLRRFNIAFFNFTHSMVNKFLFVAQNVMKLDGLDWIALSNLSKNSLPFVGC